MVIFPLLIVSSIITATTQDDIPYTGYAKACTPAGHCEELKSMYWSDAGCQRGMMMALSSWISDLDNTGSVYTLQGKIECTPKDQKHI